MSNLRRRIGQLETGLAETDSGPWVQFTVEVEAAWPKARQDAVVEAAYRDAEARYGPKETWGPGVHCVVVCLQRESAGGEAS